MLRKLSKNQKGFTLIELMIVVAIIGILAAIAIPNFRNYQLKSKRGELPTNLKAIKTSALAYQAEQDVFLILAAQPRAAANLNASKRAWATDANWTLVGWQPSGEVYASYSGAVNALAMTGQALSDIDSDGTDANYTFFVNISNASSDQDVTMRTGSNVF